MDFQNITGTSHTKAWSRDATVKTMPLIIDMELSALLSPSLGLMIQPTFLKIWAIDQALRVREQAEQHAEEAYKKARGQAKQAYEERVRQALETRKETIQQAWELRRQTLEQSWKIFAKEKK